MYNQTIENNQLPKDVPQKYSLRQKMAHYKNKNEPIHLPNALNQHHQPPKNMNSIPREPASHPRESYEQYHFAQFQNRKQGCLQTAKPSLQINRFTSVAYLGNHRTASTTPSVDYQLKKPRSERQSHRVDGQSKYSLKNAKKNQRHQSIARISQDAFRRQAQQYLFTENYSQPMSAEQHPSANFESEQGKKPKYSLKINTKKSAKIDILLNLKYSDLARPIGNQPALQNQTQLSNSNNVFLNIKSKLFCGNGRSPQGGCRCQPRCFWIDTWLQMIKQPKWSDEGKATDEKQFQMAIRQIQRDLQRTQPDHPTFNNLQMLNLLNQILIGYAKVDYEVGYVQGMNFVASALVYHSCDAYKSLKIMNHLMKNTGMRLLFIGDLSYSRKIAQNLNKNLRKLSINLHIYLIKEGIDLEMFASSWYFSLCGSFVPLDAMHHFIDKFLKKGFTGVNELLITLLLKLGDRIMSLTDIELMLVFSNQKLSQFACSLDWQEIRVWSDRLLLPLIEI